MIRLPPGLVWLAAYPKSGTTWVRALLGNLLSGAGQPENINQLSVQGMAVDRDLFEDHVWLRADQLSAAAIDSLRPRVHQAWAGQHRRRGRVVKTHDAYFAAASSAAGAPAALMDGAARAIYLVRDPRDVVVSLALHYRLSLDQAIEHMSDPAWRMAPTARHLGYRLGDWGGHVEGWLAQTDMPVLLLRYEALERDPVAELGRLAAFLGLEVSAEALALAAAHSDFAELARQEAAGGFIERPRGLERFFRQGRSGGWRVQLSADQAERISARLAPAMARLGYGPPAGGGDVR